MARKQLLALVAGSCLLSSAAQADTVEGVGKTLTEAANFVGQNVLTSANKRAALVGAGILFWSGYIRLHTKKADKSGRTYNWKDLLKVWNITGKDYWTTFDALVIGHPFKVIQVKKTTVDENTKEKIQRIDKEVKSLPSGIMGMIDTYILNQIRRIIDNMKNLDEIHDRTVNFVTKGTFFEQK